MVTATSRAVVLLAAVLGFISVAQASSPVLGTILPRGGQRGTEVAVEVSGSRLGDFAEIIFYDSTLTAKDLAPIDDNKFKATIVIPADARLGEHAVRVRTKTGITILRNFYVGAFPNVAEKEPNTEFDKPQAIPLNSTVEGLVTREDVDYYVVDATKGQRLSVEVEGIRLGTMFDPYVAILDAKRFELAASDDSSLALQDPIASVIVPEDGKYFIEVRESSYGGNGSCRYRAHIGTFPRPSVPYPMGARPGESVEVKFLGDVSGELTQTVAMPAEPKDAFAVFPVHNDQFAPSPNVFRVVDLPNVFEAEPNNTIAEVTQPAEAPLAFNGIIGQEGDIDYHRFSAKKDQTFEIEVYARRLRSPLDSVLRVLAADGKQLAAADDSRGPDSYVRFKVPADGDYFIEVRDHLRKGAVDYAYRVEIAPIKPSLSMSIPRVARASQDRWAMAVPKGNRFATLMLAKRANFGGELAFTAENLPPGVTMQASNMGADTGTMPIVFEAAGDAAIGSTLVDLKAAHVDPAKGIGGHYLQNVEMVYGEPNQTPYYYTPLDKLAVGVTEAVPFKIDIVPPKVPIVRNGAMNLKVVATRNEGYTAPITLYFPFRSPGIGASSSVKIPEGKNEANYPINANGKAALGTRKVVVTAQAKVGNGAIWVSTQLVDLTVAEPYANVSIEMAAAEQGKPVEVVAKIEQKTPFEGPAKIKVVGLPAGVASQELEFTKDSPEIVFPVTVDAKSPTGQHKSLFCQFVIQQNGEPVIHKSGFGGVLRIDPPPPPSAKPVAKAPEKKAAAPATKRLTRLEKLRLEQAERVKAAAAAEG